MTDANQLPPLPTPKFTETIRGVPCITVTEHEHLMRAYALQARAQVQGEPFGYIHHFVAHDEHGALIDTTWEADGCADALPHPTQPAAWKWSHATPFYTTPQPAQAAQAEVTDSMIREAFLTNGFTIKDGHSDLKPYVYAAARAVLALRPAATFCGYCGGNDEDPVDHCMDCTRPAAVPMTPREIELIDGMIAVQLVHAQRCDKIGNRVMAERQKYWDMERVELLRRIRSIGITAQAKKETP